MSALADEFHQVSGLWNSVGASDFRYDWLRADISYS